MNIEKLKELYTYRDGKIYFKDGKNHKGVFVGKDKSLGKLSKSGYVMISVHYKGAKQRTAVIRRAKVVWRLHEQETFEHGWLRNINRIKTDDRIENLEVVWRTKK